MSFGKNTPEFKSENMNSKVVAFRRREDREPETDRTERPKLSVEQPRREERRGEKRRKERKPKPPKRKQRWFPYIFALLCVLIACSGYLLLTHKFFNIKYVRLSGNHNISAKTIVESLGNVNGNIFLYSAKNAEKKLGELKGVRGARVVKTYPNRISVELEESYWLGRLIKDGKELYIDQDGVIRKSSDLPISNVCLPPECEGFSGDLKEGSRVSSDERVIALLNLVMQSGLAPDIRKINFEKLNDIDIIYKDIAIHFGDLNNLIDKLSTVEAVIKDVEAKKISAVEILLDQGPNPIVVTDKPAE